MAYRAFFMLSVLLLSVPAMAQDQPVKQKRPKMTCRDAAETGTHMLSTTCHTEEEWKAIDGARDDNASRMLNGISRIAGQSGGNITGAPGPH